MASGLRVCVAAVGVAVGRVAGVVTLDVTGTALLHAASKSVATLTARPAVSRIRDRTRRGYWRPVTTRQRLTTGRTWTADRHVLEIRSRMKLPTYLFRLLDLFSRKEGQGMVEYALILVLIAVVVIVVLIILGNQVQNVFCNISGGLGM